MRQDSVHLKLNELLDANASFDLAARGTTNHCPMALVALAEMGASAARLQGFFDMWSRDYALNAVPVDTVVHRHQWSKYLGNGGAFGALRMCFLNWIAEAGATPVITSVLEEAPFAPATLAFHALIRLAYGIEAKHDGEIATALAAYVSGHLAVDIELDANHAAQSADAGFKRVIQTMRDVAVEGKSITARLRNVASDARFRSAVLAPPAALSLEDLARAAISAYWRTPDFTVLHTVTATHAARVVLAQLPDSFGKRLMPAMWIALCAAYATVARSVNDKAEETPVVTADCNEVCRLAVASDDDHVIKMTHTCLCEDRRYPSPLYLASAARLVRRSQVATSWTTALAQGD